ncbi:hypothetical protein LJC46_01915 [Desulfovibrio sp. OttesenSCG-928-G15]|nr:hypothetical protein [Desulfovibrio sp. OttesenSCG-928-G15]
MIDGTMLPRGFLLAPRQKAIPIDKWEKLHFGNFQLLFEKSNSIAVSSIPGRHVVILGTAIDVRCAKRMEREITDDFIHSSLEDILSALDDIAGRYVILLIENNKAIVIGDATNTKTISYSTQGDFVVSSHPTLIAKINSATPNAVAEEYLALHGPTSSFCYPGDMSPWNEIAFLTANCYITSERELVRFWPREEIQSLPTADVAELLLSVFSAQWQNIAMRDRPVILSLSAGIDSRISLAVGLHYFPTLRTFCYNRTNTDYYRADASISNEIANDCNLNHTIFTCSPDSVPDSFFKKQSHVDIINLRRPEAFVLQNHFDHDSLHIHSILTDAVKESVFFWTHGNRVQNLHQLLHSAHFHPTEALLGPLDSWTHRSRFWQAVQCGIRAEQLYHWEAHHSKAKSLWLQERDAVFESLALFNCRRLMAALSTVPMHDIANGAALQEALELASPPLARYPLNKQYATLIEPFAHAKMHQEYDAGDLASLDNGLPLLLFAYVPPDYIKRITPLLPKAPPITLCAPLCWREEYRQVCAEQGWVTGPLMPANSFPRGLACYDEQVTTQANSLWITDILPPKSPKGLFTYAGFLSTRPLACLPVKQLFDGACKIYYAKNAFAAATLMGKSKDFAIWGAGEYYNLYIKDIVNNDIYKDKCKYFIESSPSAKTIDGINVITPEMAIAEPADITIVATLHHEVILKEAKRVGIKHITFI